MKVNNVLKAGFGGVETLITHPASVSYYALTQSEREKIGIVDGLIRLSLGLEYLDDIIADLKQALSIIK